MWYALEMADDVIVFQKHSLVRLVTFVRHVCLGNMVALLLSIGFLFCFLFVFVFF